MESDCKFGSTILAYQQGALARKDGIVVGDNPFGEDEDDFWFWTRGWLDGVEKAPALELSITNN